MTLQLALWTFAPFNREKSRQAEQSKAIEEKLQALKDNIEFTKCEINSATENFNNVTETCLIDYYIYKIQSEQSRFSQLLYEYKELEAKFLAMTAQ